MAKGLFSTVVVLFLAAVAVVAPSLMPNDSGAEFVIIEPVAAKPLPKFEPFPDAISVDDILAPAPTPHANCRCTTCDCTPACVGACSLPQPAGDATAPIANSTPAASAAPATSGSASSCPGGRCSISTPIRRGIFGWRR